ncbi:hypothetical protein ACFWYW_30480 [Nonomuraea sp. NPDC059023]|uniref:hypothetical protein n=1 Tax=unclassified Nonomuraea TaxID=2593643 RepID=UPI0036B76C4A
MTRPGVFGYATEVGAGASHDGPSATFRRWLGRHPRAADLLLVCTLIVFDVLVWADYSTDDGLLRPALIVAQVAPLA